MKSIMQSAKKEVSIVDEESWAVSLGIRRSFSREMGIERAG
jgi:hypothetical protein